LKIIDDRTVELTDAEIVVKDWHDSLLDRGMGLASAVVFIKDSVPQESLTHRLVTYMEPYLVEGAQAMDPSADVPTVRE
jgi:hypothetical protein